MAQDQRATPATIYAARSSLSVLVLQGYQQVDN